MNRPTYQDQADVDNEARIMGFICDSYSVEADPMPKYWPYDYRTFRKANDGTRTLVGMVEIKCRIKNEPLSIERLRHYWISKAKVDTCILEAEKNSEDLGYTISFFLVVEFIEGVYQAKIDRINARLFKVKRGGRFDRGDTLDIEDGYMIPISKFQRIL